MRREVECLVLGAGIAGLSAALHLQARGLSVAVVDRGEPGGETSFGNAGLIQAEAVVPYAFPRDWRRILGVATGRAVEARLAWRALGAVGPWLWRYWRAGAPDRVAAAAAAMAPLIARAVPEHRALAARAGAEAQLRAGGYLRVSRSEAVLDAAAAAEAETAARYGSRYERCDRAAVAALEPHLSDRVAGGILHPEVLSLGDPAALCRAYADLLRAEGGALLSGDAAGAERGAGAAPWRLATPEGAIAARHLVVALGPWSGDWLAARGVRTPLGVKRGYHRHFQMAAGAALRRPVVDEDFGYVLAPMRRGLRLTSGAEFDRRDAPPTPVQLARIAPIARELAPVGAPIDPAPWLGARPCFPDLVPAIGAVPGAPGLWTTTGHGHLGLTLGPATGRLLAEMIAGEAPFTDPAPYRIDRF